MKQYVSQEDLLRLKKIQLMNSLKSLLRSCSLSVVCVKTKAVNNFFGVRVTTANKFQTKITLKVVSESTKVAYI